jgi:small multidrug resistance pump
MPPGVLLAIAIVVEVSATIALRYSEGFTRPGPTAIVVAGYGTCFFLISQVMKHYEVGFTYAVWSGAGTALIAIVGIVALGESATAVKVVSLGLIVAGVVGLNLTSASP